MTEGDLKSISDCHAADTAACVAVVKRIPPIIGANPRYVGLARPASAEEVAVAVKSARSRGWGILRVYNDSAVGAQLHGKGDTLIIDLSRLNRVLEVNPDYGYARVEAAVSFAQLAAHLNRNNLPLLVDSERDATASIAGSLYSKGFGYTPYGDHTLVQCGAEYVLPDGDRLRSGMGAMADNRSWQVYKYALGPYSDGLAVQSDFLIPTQTGIWLMGQVPKFLPFAIDVADDAALGLALEALRPLKINGTLPGTLSITHRNLDSWRSGQPNRPAAWRLHAALYGLPEVVRLSMGAVQAAFAAAPGCRMVPDEELTHDAVWQGHSALMAGQPGPSGSDAPHFRKAPSASLTFVAPIEGDAAQDMQRHAQAAARDVGVRCLPEFSVLGRALLQTLHVPYEHGAGDLHRLEGFARKLIPAMGEAGYGLIRESLELSHIASTSIGEHPLGALQERIATAFA